MTLLLYFSAMPEPLDSDSQVTRREVPIIAHLYEEVSAEESRRRCCPVDKTDPVVRQRVAEMVLRIGAELRETMRDQARPGTDAG